MELMRLLLAALLLLTVSGVSNGVLSVCNVDMAIGAGTSIMKWVKAPQNSTKYTITSSAQSYQPGALVPITINVTDLDYIYIGILLVAEGKVNGTTVNVGQWTVAAGDDYFLPATCKFSAVVHASAELKPMEQTFYWKGDAGTGPVTFRALIKQGEQNHGNFYKPEPFVLTESPTPVAAQTVWRGPRGASCDETCGLQNAACDATATLGLSSASILKSKVKDYYACREPYLKACGPPATGMSQCYYSSCSTGQTWDSTAVCSRRSSDPYMDQQFCVCKAGAAKRDPVPPADAATAILGYRLLAPLQLDAEVILNSLEISNGTATVDISGPQDRWFAIGWDASYMDGAYTTVVSLNNPAVQKPQNFANIGDKGVGDGLQGWYDARCQQALNDYCRTVGGANNRWFSCALSGTNKAYTNAYNATDNMTFRADLTSRVPCKKGKIAPYLPMTVSEHRLTGTRTAIPLNSTITIVNSLVDAGQWRISFKRSLTAANANQMAFPDKKSFPVIWSIGIQQHFGTSASNANFIKHDRKSELPVTVTLVPFYPTCPGKSPTQPTQPTAPTAPTSPTGAPTGFFETVSGGFSTLPSTLVLGSLAALGSKNWVLGVFLAALIRPTLAHNWVNGPSRAQIAAVTVPCVTRVNPAPHLQVAPNQEFQMEWSTGHGDTPTIWTYWIFVKEQDYDRLAEVTDSKLEDYLAKAPTASVFTGDKWTKRHLSPWRNYLGTGACNGCNNGSLIPGTFKEAINPTDPRYIVRNPESIKLSLKRSDPNVTQFWYNDDMISGDKRAAYYSNKYPYIISVHKFRIANHWPDELDMATFSFPNAGFGNYIAHFKWGGYRDCTDVHLINMPTVPNPWGVSQNSTSTFTRIDHCAFTFVTNPNTNCKKMINQNASQCLADCLKSGGCTSVQAVRKANPAGTFPYTPNYPTKKYTYNQSLANIFPPPESGPCDSRTIHKRLPCPDPQPMCNQTFVDTLVDSDYLCYGLTPYRDQDFQTTDDYVITNDPKNPNFYSTCWIKLAPGTFLDYPQPVKPSPVWRTGKKCLSCSWLKNTLPSYPLSSAPAWVDAFSTECEDCDVYADPTCKEDFGYVDGGSTGNCSIKVSSGQTCQGSCDFGFTPFGSPRMCKNGVLTGPQQACVFKSCA